VGRFRRLLRRDLLRLFLCPLRSLRLFIKLHCDIFRDGVLSRLTGTYRKIELAFNGDVFSDVLAVSYSGFVSGARFLGVRRFGGLWLLSLVWRTRLDGFERLGSGLAD